MTDTRTKSSSQATPKLGATPVALRAPCVAPNFAAEPARTMASEVLEKSVRRRFTAAYKRRILSQADACTEPGAIGELLRREGLYSSHLSKWRAQREAAIHEGLSKPRGRQRQEKNPLAGENARLQKENQRLQARLMQAKTIIEVQKKLSQLLGLSEDPTHHETSS